ncbi:MULTISPECIES: hypothetical protein [unclassified Arthrobacter]|uniref:hypothetical protein n=1 Tax=unclassified Arthrobacter TaxID=235627 RepID=UPI00339A2AD8
MEHLNADLLSLLALREPLGTPAGADHLASCPECCETLRGLQHTVHIAALDLAGIELEVPSGQTWAAVHQALGLSPTLATDPLSHHAAGPPVAPGRPAVRPKAAEVPLKQGPGPAQAPMRPDSGNRHGRPWLWTATAAAGILLGTAEWTAAGVFEHNGTPAPASTQSGPLSIILAQTSLAPLPPHSGSGDA